MKYFVGFWVEVPKKDMAKQALFYSVRYETIELKDIEVHELSDINVKYEKKLHERGASLDRYAGQLDDWGREIRIARTNLDNLVAHAERYAEGHEATRAMFTRIVERLHRELSESCPRAVSAVSKLPDPEEAEG